MPPPPLRLPSAGAGTPVLVILGVGFPCTLKEVKPVVV